MKAQIGVEVDSGRAHIAVGVEAAVADVDMVRAAPRRSGGDVFGGAGYRCVYIVGENNDLEITGRLARWPRKCKVPGAICLDGLLVQCEQAKVEHPFDVVKPQFRYPEMSCREVSNTTAQLRRAFDPDNLVLVRRGLRTPHTAHS